ncbi:hypothetical protein F5884DRAFT_804945 [Xylogone sp. PMI_703]|nr:hypothetical protein F5884DRAFT_804945 [Xylogone sp. PMI_703]
MQATMQAPDLQDQLQPPLQPPPNFSPFFTLIHDPSTSSTIHPSRVHYLFSDDDASDLLTNACIRSLAPHHPTNPPADYSQPPSLASSKHLVNSTTSSSSSSRQASRAHKSEKSKSKRNVGTAGGGEREERVLIIDMNDTGDAVLSATSLSPEWQIVNAEIRNAPTWDGGDERKGEEEDGEGRKLMLRVEGVGVGAEEKERDGVEGSEGGGAGLGEEEMLAIMESFDRKMAVLRKIVGRDVGLVDEEREEAPEEAPEEAKGDDKDGHIEGPKEGDERVED